MFTHDAETLDEELLSGEAAKSADGECRSAETPGEEVHSRAYCSRKFLGILCLVMCLASWEAMGELLQDLNTAYAKPAFLTYCTHSAYAIVLVPWFLWRGRKAPHIIRQRAATIKLSLIFLPILYGAAYFWFISLPLTLVSANNAIYQSSCVFVYALSIMFLSEKIRVRKIAGLLMLVGGVVVVIVFSVSRKDSGSSPAPSNSSELRPSFSSPLVPSPVPVAVGHVGKDSLWGYFSLLCSVILFALYEVLFKVAEIRDSLEHRGAVVREDSDIQRLDISVIFLGFSGLFNAAIAWFVVYAFNRVNLEPFRLPDEKYTKLILINAVLDTVFNAAFLWGVTLMSPVFMSTGTVIIIPIGVVVDYLLGKGILTTNALIGILLIVSGFSIMNCECECKKTEDAKENLALLPHMKMKCGKLNIK